MRKKTLFPICGAAALGLTVWLAWGNSAIETSRYALDWRTLPAEFDGFCIAHVSDVHNSALGRERGTLLTLLENERPDIIVITGDLLDSRQTNTSLALEFAAGASAIAPSYYVPGNHESRLEIYPAFCDELRDVGVKVLENERAVLRRGEATISLLGLKDPAFLDVHKTKKDAAFEKIIGRLSKEDNDFTLLLCHRPEYFELYCKYGAELSLCGHTHGGQLRLPFIGGLIAPHQGWLPGYDAGLFQSGKNRMLISRGIGNSLCPLRVNDRPELIIAELKKA